MTLISMINGLGFPVIVSDRAISSNGETGNVILPTTNRETFSPTPVVEFRVKTVIIKQVLCVAFAGNLVTIENLYSDIVDFFLHRPVNTENLQELINELEYDRDVSLLFALGGPEFSENRVMVMHSADFIIDNSKENLDIISCGSGAVDWTKHFVHNAGYLQPTGIRSLDSKQRALLSCISFVSHEQFSTAQLRDGWGGGFDIVYYEDGRFHRYDQVTFALYVADVDRPKHLKPINIIHNSYEHGNVIVRNLMADNPLIHYIHQFKSSEPLPSNLTMNCASKDIVSCVFLQKIKRFRTASQFLSMTVIRPHPHYFILHARMVNSGYSFAPFI